MMKQKLNLWLLAALLGGMILSVTSCKDDDSNSSSEGEETYEGLSTLEDDQLADLIAAWTDTGRSDLNGTAWRSATYEPTVGLALEESQPGIRYVPVGTIDEADDYATSVLGTLGINYEQPAGFTYNNSLVGKVSYSHGDGGNTLATITVDIPQIPVLQEIRLIKDLPENAGGSPYYKCGDIVKYKNRFYLCVSKHRYGQEARFITVNDQETHKRGKFTYMGVGIDSVYNDEMAKAEVLGDWLQNVVCDYKMWENVRSRMSETGNAESIRQLVPEDNNVRVTFVSNLANKANYIPEVSQTNKLEESNRTDIMSFMWTDTPEKDKRGKTTGFRWELAPAGFLLADKLRYTLITDKWVPYIFLCRDGETFDRLYELEQTIESQYKNPSHFKFKLLNQFEITKNDNLVGLPTFHTDGHDLFNYLREDKYYVCVIGMHWTHAIWYVMMGQFEVKSTIDFCKDYKYHPDDKIREKVNKHPEDWTYRNVTSRSLTFTDKGKKNKKWDDVYIAK